MKTQKTNKRALNSWLHILSIFILFLSLSTSFAQSIANGEIDSLEAQQISREVYRSRKNIVKLSATSLIFRNFQFQYERILNKTFSVGLSYALIPEGKVPFESVILNTVKDEDEVKRYIEDAEVKYSSITPEVRIYLGKGYGKGFYVAPFFRHSKHQAKNVNIYYDTVDGTEQHLIAKTSINANTFGLLIGAQFNLGSRIVLDWFILGPHYGSSNGDFNGLSTQPMSEADQESLRRELDDIDFPIGDFTYEVDENGATGKVDGPWGGIRAGLSLGVRF